jgi:alkylated DNA nucleotide flippase Atl1
MPKTAKKSSRTASVKPAPRINPTENITSYGSIAGSQDEKSVVTLVRGDDWTGLYVGDKLVEEGHSLPAFRVIDALKNVGRYTYVEREADQELLEDSGSLPESLTQAYAERIISE